MQQQPAFLILLAFRQVPNQIYFQNGSPHVLLYRYVLQGSLLLPWNTLRRHPGHFQPSQLTTYPNSTSFPIKSFASPSPICNPTLLWKPSRPRKLPKFNYSHPKEQYWRFHHSREQRLESHGHPFKMGEDPHFLIRWKPRKGHNCRGKCWFSCSTSFNIEPLNRWTIPKSYFSKLQCFNPFC